MCVGLRPVGLGVAWNLQLESAEMGLDVIIGLVTIFLGIAGLGVALVMAGENVTPGRR